MVRIKSKRQILRFAKKFEKAMKKDKDVQYFFEHLEEMRVSDLLKLRI